jgi:hypothetical protein
MKFQGLESVWVEFNESLMQAITEKESGGGKIIASLHLIPYLITAIDSFKIFRY